MSWRPPLYNWVGLAPLYHQRQPGIAAAGLMMETGHNADPDIITGDYDLHDLSPELVDAESNPRFRQVEQTLWPISSPAGLNFRGQGFDLLDRDIDIIILLNFAFFRLFYIFAVQSARQPENAGNVRYGVQFVGCLGLQIF